MKETLKILILEDSISDAELIQRVLKKEKKNWEFHLAMDKESFKKTLNEFLPDVILSDNSLPQFDSSEALRITRQQYSHIPFILVTGTVSDEFAANIMKSGADDYILKDRMTRLSSAIEAALKKRRAEKEIADYKYALDQSAIVAITDQKGIIIYANQNFCKISKYSAEELIGQDHRIINSGYHDASFIRYLWVTIASGKIWRGEFRNRAKDGSFYWVDTTIIPFLNEERKPYQYLSIRIDITENKKGEEALRQSNERFQYATEATSDIIWELNFETQQYLAHEDKEKHFTVNSKIGWRLGVEGKYIVEEDREKVQQSFRDAKMDKDRTLWEYEYRVYSEDNSILYIINHAMFIRDKKGKAIRVIGAITDITERKRLELKLLEQQRNEQLKITATALEAQEKERTLLGQELHDNVNQILVGAKLLLSMVKNHPEKAGELVNSSIGYLQDAIEENRKLSHRLVTPDLEMDSLAKQLFDLVNSMLETAKVKTHIDTERLQEELLTDQQKIAIYRIAQEQCTNIIKYAKAGNVTISLQTTDGLFKMAISDDGQGMKEGKTTKGIGLQNITGRISIFDGKARIKTRPGKGFTLEVEMPVKERSV